MEVSEISFGEYVRTKRLEKELSLRKFCELAEIDPSNWSKIERGRFQAPSNRDELESIAKILGIQIGTSDWTTFSDLAYKTQRMLPKEVYSNEEVMNVLPIFFRGALGEKPTEEELQKLIEVLKNR